MGLCVETPHSRAEQSKVLKANSFPGEVYTRTSSLSLCRAVARRGSPGKPSAAAHGGEKGREHLSMSAQPSFLYLSHHPLSPSR